MRIRDWSSDGCSSDLLEGVRASVAAVASTGEEIRGRRMGSLRDELKFVAYAVMHLWLADGDDVQEWETAVLRLLTSGDTRATARSEEHTSELQSLMRNSYAVFCLQKKSKTHNK